MNLSQKSGESAALWHARAATACGELGQDGAPAFPAMLEAAKNEVDAGRVLMALSRMLPRSAPVLTNLVGTGSAETRSYAAQLLMTARSQPEIEEMARLALLRALQDGDPRPRSMAAAAFQFWTQRLDVVVPALTRALSDPDPVVRGIAANSLGNFRSGAKSAVPELLKLLHDENDYPRTWARESLKKIEAASAAGD